MQYQVPSQVQSYMQKFTGTITSINLPGGFIFAPSYLQAGLIVFLLFLLVLTLGQLRRRVMEWHFKGVVPGVYLGFTLAVIIEGFLLIGGRTILTGLLGWENPPKPLANALDAGRNKMVSVLGVTDEIPSSNASELPTIEKIMDDYVNLTPDDQQEIDKLICR